MRTLARNRDESERVIIPHAASPAGKCANLAKIRRTRKCVFVSSRNFQVVVGGPVTTISTRQLCRVAIVWGAVARLAVSHAPGDVLAYGAEPGSSVISVWVVVRPTWWMVEPLAALRI